VSVVRDRSSHDSIPETLHSILRMGFENVRLDNVIRKLPSRDDNQTPWPTYVSMKPQPQPQPQPSDRCRIEVLLPSVSEVLD